MVGLRFHIKSFAGEGVGILCKIAAQDFAEDVVDVAGFAFAFMVAERGDAAECIVSIVESSPLWAMSVAAIVACRGELLLGDYPAVGPVVGRGMLALGTGKLQQYVKAVVEIALQDVFAFCLVDPAIEAVVPIAGAPAFGGGVFHQEIIGIIFVLRFSIKASFSYPVAVGVIGIDYLTRSEHLVCRVVLVGGRAAIFGLAQPVAHRIIGIADQ